MANEQKLNIKLVADDSEIKKTISSLQTSVEDVKVSVDVDSSGIQDIKQEFKKVGDIAKTEGKEAGKDYASGVSSGAGDIDSKLKKEFAKAADAAGDAGKDAGKSFGDKFSGMLDSIGGGGGVGGLLQGAIGGGVAGLATAGLETGFELLKGAITGVIDKAQELGNLTTAVAQITGKSGDDLIEYSTKLSGMAATYNVDSQELLVAANNISKQLGGDINANLELINEAYARGADVNGGFMDIIKEYGNSFKELGLTAEQTMAFVTNTSKQGLFDDKAVDTVKEANLRLREMTPATKDALNAIGISADRVQKALQDGSKTTFDIIQEVSGALGKLPDSSAAVGTAIADIFGGPGEDAGLQYLRSLKDVNLEFEKMPQAQQKIADMQKESVDSAQRLDKAFLSSFGGLSTYIQEAKTIWTNFQAQLLEWIDPWIDNIVLAFEIIWPPTKAWFDILGSIWDVAMSIIQPLTVSGQSAEAMKSTSQKIADVMKLVAEEIRGVANWIRVAKQDLMEFLGIADKGSGKKIRIQIEQEKDMRKMTNEFNEFQTAIQNVAKSAANMNKSEFDASKSKLVTGLNSLKSSAKITGEQYELLNKQIQALKQGSASGGGTSAITDISQQIEAAINKTEELKSKLTLNTMEDTTQRQIAELKKQNENEIKAIQEQEENWKTAKNVSSKQRQEIIAALGLEEIAQVNLNAQEENSLFDKLAADNLKKLQDRLAKEVDAELQIKEAQLQTLTSQDEATIKRRYDIQREIALSENEARINELLSQNEEYSKKQLEIEKLQLTNTPVEQVNAANAELSTIKEKILKTDTLINAELLLQAAALDVINLNDAQAAEESRINAIGNLYEREREMAVFSAKKQYDETVLLAGGSYEHELSAFVDLQNAKYVAQLEYFTKTQSTAQQMIGTITSAFSTNFTSGLVLPDNEDQLNSLRGEIDGMDAMFADLKDKYNQGEIDRKEYNEQLNKLDDERKSKIQELADAEVTVWETMAQTLANTFRDIAKSYQESQTKMLEASQENYSKRIQLEDEYNQEVVKYATLSQEGKVDEAEKSAEKLATIIAAQTKNNAESAKIIGAAWMNAGVIMGSTFAQIAFEEKKFVKATVMTFLKGLQAIAPMYIAKAVGANITNPASLIWAGLAIAGFDVVMAVAEAGVNKLNFLKGGLNPHGFGGNKGFTGFGRKSVMVEYNENQKPEFMIDNPTLMAGNNLEIFTRLIQNPMPIEDYLLGDAGFQRKMTGSVPTISVDTKELVKEQKLTNQKLDRLAKKSTVVNINMKGDMKNIYALEYNSKVREAHR